MRGYRFGEIIINSTQKKKPIEEDRLHCAGLEHIDPGCFEIQQYGSEVAPVGEELIMKKGGILSEKRRTYQRKVAIAPYDGILSAHGMVLKPRTRVIDSSYFPFFISSGAFMETMIHMSMGSLSPTMNWRDLAKQEFGLPPLGGQEDFVDELWVIYRLKGAYRELLTATDETVKLQFIEMFEDVESYRRLGNLVSDIFPGEWGSESTSENTMKVIRTINFVNEGYLDLTDVVTKDIEPKRIVRKKLKQGGIILERSGGTKDSPIDGVIFFDEVGDYLPSNFTQALRPKGSVDPMCLFYALCNSYSLDKTAMRAMAGQTTDVQDLSISNFMARFIVLPLRNEQNKFEQIYHQTDRSKSELKQYIEDIDEVVKGLTSGQNKRDALIVTAQLDN